MKTVRVYSKNKIYTFKLDSDFDDYLQLKLDDYLREILENNFINKAGRKLELITAYKNKSLMYEDIPNFIKEKYDLPIRDEGIDVIKLSPKLKILECFQCKDFNGYVSNHDLGTFYAFKINNDKFKETPFTIVGSNNTKFPKNVKYISYDINEFNSKNTQEISESVIVEQIQLRHYQIKAIEHIDSAVSEFQNNIRIKLPTGCGKTQIIYHYCKQQDKKILILVPRIAIAEQIKLYFDNVLKLPIECYWFDVRQNNNSNIILSVYNSVDRIPKTKFDMIFIDEAHHILGSELYQAFVNENEIDNNNNYITSILKLESKFIVYLSATIDIKTKYDYEYSMDQAIAEGFLSDYEIHLMYVSNDNKDRDLIKIIKENKEYKHIIVYCNQIATATRLVKYLNENQIPSDVVTSKTKKKDRNSIIDSFKNGLLKIICSVDCLNEGVDLPIADTAIFYNNRKAEINIIQCIGRVLRLHDFKPKSHIVLLDSDSKNCEKNCTYYLNAINKTDKFFKQRIEKTFRSYDYRNISKNKSSSLSGRSIIKTEDKYFNKITKIRMTFQDRLESCMRFKEKYDRIPRSKEPLFENWNIGSWIHNTIKRRPSDDKERIEVEKIFGTLIYEYIGKQIKIENKLKLFKEYYNKFHKIPNNENEKYKNVNIGRKFNYMLKNNEKIIPRLEEIFEMIYYNGSCVHKDNIKIVLNMIKKLRIYQCIDVSILREFGYRYFDTLVLLNYCNENQSDYRIKLINQLKESYDLEFEYFYKSNLYNEIITKYVNLCLDYIQKNNPYGLHCCSVINGLLSLNVNENVKEELIDKIEEIIDKDFYYDKYNKSIKQINLHELMLRFHKTIKGCCGNQLYEMIIEMYSYSVNLMSKISTDFIADLFKNKNNTKIADSIFTAATIFNITKIIDQIELATDSVCYNKFLYKLDWVLECLNKLDLFYSGKFSDTDLTILIHQLNLVDNIIYYCVENKKEHILKFIDKKYDENYFNKIKQLILIFIKNKVDDYLVNNDEPNVFTTNLDENYIQKLIRILELYKMK